MTFRENSFIRDEKAVVNSQELADPNETDGYVSITDIFSDSAIKEEKRRSLLISDMEEAMRLKVQGVETETKILKREEKEDKVILTVYVITHFYYKDASVAHLEDAAVDKSSFGTKHLITFEKSESGYRLMDDVYDEGPLTGMKVS